jgi:hypothetical protein
MVVIKVNKYDLFVKENIYLKSIKVYSKIWIEKQDNRFTNLSYKKSNFVNNKDKDDYIYVYI